MYVCILSRSGIFNVQHSAKTYLVILVVLEKENFPFQAFLVLKTFPLILSLLKSHIQISLLRNIIALPWNNLATKGGLVRLERKIANSNFFSFFMYVSLISEEDKVVPAKVVICDFPLSKLVNKIVCHLTDCTKYNKMFVSWCNGRWWRALKSCFFSSSSSAFVLQSFRATSCY